jgi:hypothetical protein
MDKSMGCIFIHIYLTFWIHPFSHHPIHTFDLYSFLPWIHPFLPMDKSMGCIFIHIYLTIWIHPFSSSHTHHGFTLFSPMDTSFSSHG